MYLLWRYFSSSLRELSHIFHYLSLQFHHLAAQGSFVFGTNTVLYSFHTVSYSFLASFYNTQCCLHRIFALIDSQNLTQILHYGFLASFTLNLYTSVFLPHFIIVLSLQNIFINRLFNSVCFLRIAFELNMGVFLWEEITIKRQVLESSTPNFMIFSVNLEKKV